MAPADIENRLVEHDQIKAKIDRNGEVVKLKLKKGDRIFVLPDPSYLVSCFPLRTGAILEATAFRSRPSPRRSPLRSSATMTGG